MAGPDSSYSALEIHIDWNVESDERRACGRKIDLCPHAYYVYKLELEVSKKAAFIRTGGFARPVAAACWPIAT